MTDISAIRIETPRLILRPPQESDFDSWADFMADEEAARFIGGAQPRGAAWRGFATMAGSWLLKGFGMFSVIEKETGNWVGRLGPWMPDGWPGTEIGWGLSRAAHGRGYATEGSAAAIDWAFDTLGWDEVIHVIDPDNTPSIVLAERLGSSHRGPCKLPAPLEDFPVHIWGQTRAEWAENRKRFIT